MYTVDVWDGEAPRRFRSLSAAVKFLLQAEEGNIRFPNGQTAYITFWDSGIDVKHRTHPWTESDDDVYIKGLEQPGLQRLAQVIRRFSPGMIVRVQGEWSRLEV